MKMKLSCFPRAPAMGTLAYVLVALISTSIASALQSDSAKTSVEQIRDTLRNLLRSIDDAGKEAEALFSKRQAWCDSSIKKFEAAGQVSAANLVDMQDQLTEHEAEAEEASGTVQQIKVDIAMVQHTVKQSEDMLNENHGLTYSGGNNDVHLLQSLVDNKKLSLSSLQGQLDVAIPVFAQLQETVAETKQRISYRSDSMVVAKGFIAALKEGCQAGSDRADTQAAARMGESNSIHVTLQALDGMEAQHSEPHEGQVSPLSFVQMQEVTVDDLTDLFNDQRPAPVVHAPPEERAPPPSSNHARHAPSVSALKPRIATLLSQLKSGGISASDKAEWCSKQREDSALALKSAQDAVAQLSSELDAHVATEAELAEELKRLQDLSGALTASSNTIVAFAKKEQAHLQSTRKDQELASKILEQATTILKEMGVANATQAVAGLQAAQKMIGAQVKATSDFEKEAMAKARNIAEEADAFLKTQASEEHNLEFARDDHEAQRSRGVGTKRMYEENVKEAAAYVQKLQDSCKSDAEADAAQQRTVQMRALEDANRALDGKLVKAQASAQLRGVDAQPKTSEHLTPMQRAAAEMGVSIE